MTLFKISTVLALVLVVSASASAAVVRTGPFPGYAFGVGEAHCAVVNAGTTPGNATVVLYQANGFALETDTFNAVPANVTMIGESRSLAGASPTFCECTIPNTTNWRCSFIHIHFLTDRVHVTVIEAK